MAEQRPNIRPSDQLLPGALGSTRQDPLKMKEWIHCLYQMYSQYH